MCYDEIETVKEINNKKGYLINNSLSFMIADENSELLDSVKQWLAEGNEPEAEFSAEELESQRVASLKQAKKIALDNIVVDVDGKLFDGNETARLNIMSAIQASELFELNETGWKLADNTAVLVNLAELKMALALSIEEVGRIVMVTKIEDL